MLWKNSLKHLATLSGALVLGIAPASAHTKPILINQNQSIPLKISEAFQPPDRGAPPRTADGGARGCGLSKPGEKQLSALTPSNYLPLTVAEYPSFFWYVPQSPAKTLEFTLRDEKDLEVIYKTQLPVPNQSGVVSLSLKAGDLPPLKVGKMYHWYLAMVCDAEDRTGDTVVDGWIERTELNQALKESLKNASLNDRPMIYAKAGIWHESLAGLAELRRNNPEDATLAGRWKDLLNSVQLNEFADEPTVETNQISQE